MMTRDYMKQTYADNLTAWREYRAQIAQDAETLCEIVQKHRFNGGTPEQAAREIVQAIGAENARVIIASAVNAHEGDGRLSAAVIEWAQGIGWDWEMSCNLGLTLDSKMHMCHINQTAEALMNLPEDEPEQPETEPAEADETETNEQEENTMEIRHNDYSDMPYIEFRKKFHSTLKRYPGMECTYNPHYAYQVTTTKYYKIGNKWHEKTEEKTVETVPGNYYMNMIDAIPFFRNLGGSERVQMGYTLAGYIPTQLSSISPDGKEKVLRKFKPVQI